MLFGIQYSSTTYANWIAVILYYVPVVNILNKMAEIEILNISVSIILWKSSNFYFPLNVYFMKKKQLFSLHHLKNPVRKLGSFKLLIFRTLLPFKFWFVINIVVYNDINVHWHDSQSHWKSAEAKIWLEIERMEISDWSTY